MGKLKQVWINCGQKRRFTQEERDSVDAAFAASDRKVRQIGIPTNVDFPPMFQDIFDIQEKMEELYSKYNVVHTRS
jgi:CBS domain containing-hemolysin-like protein